jgi:hypothetical protein
MTREEKSLFWQNLLTEQNNSELNIVGFCHEHEVAPWKFYYWRRRLKELDVSNEPSFVELNMAADPSDSGIRIKYNNLEVSLSTNFDDLTFRRVLRHLC